jgi:hypothetical protein
MADQPAPLSLSVFSTDATAPVPTTPAPVSPVAEQGPVAPDTEFTTQTAQEGADRLAKDSLKAQDLQNEADFEMPKDDKRGSFYLYMDEDSSIAATMRQATNAGFPPTLGYSAPKYDSPEGKELYKGIPTEDLARFGTAVSPEHAQYIHNEILHEHSIEQEWADHSGWGRLGVGLVDPVNLALMLTGAGEVQTVSRVGRFLKGGVTAAGENAALTEFLDQGKQTSSGHDVAQAALAGFMLGGVLHALPSEGRVEASNAAHRMQRDLAINELTDHVESGTIPEQAVRPDVLAEVKARQAADQLVADRAHADAQVSHVDSQVTEHLAGEETRLKGITEGEDGQIVSFHGENPAGDAHETLASAKATLDESSKVLSEDSDVQIKREAARLADADEKNAYARDRAAPGKEAVFPKWQAAAVENVARTRAQAAHTAELARGVISNAQKDVERVNRVAAANTDLEQLRLAQKGAKTTEDRVAAVAHKPLRDQLGKRLKAARDEQARVEAAHAEATKVAPQADPTSTVGEPSSFGADSASAARATTDVAPAVELSQGIKPVPRSSDAIKVVNVGPFKTFSSVLRGSTNAIVRSRLGRMFGEAVAAHGGSAATQGASDHMAVLSHSWGTRAAQIDYAHKFDWMREQGYSGFWNRYSQKVQQEWGNAVGRAIRGIESDSKPVKEAARKYAGLYKDMLKAAKEAGVKGFDDVSENEHYLPRAFEFNRLKEINRTLGDNGMANFLADSMEKGMRDAGPIDRESMVAIAKGYVQRSKRLGLGIDNAMLNGIHLDDFEYIRGLLAEGTSDTAAVDRVIDSLKAKAYASADGAGATRYAKFRVKFDETHSMNVRTPEGEMSTVSVADMWNNDVGQVTERYVRTMSGHTAMARVGIRSEADFQQSLAESLSSLDEAGAPKEERDLVESYAQGGYKLITGRPLDNDKYGLFLKGMSVARDYAYTRSMNQAGFSIANNLIRPWTNGYAKYTAKYMPAMAQLFKRGADGELDHPLMKEIERFTGIGADSVNMHIWSQFEADSLTGKALNAVGQKLKVAGRVTSHISGMTPGLVFGQRMMSLGILDRIVRHAHGETSIPTKRLGVMGLDEDMLGRIKSQLVDNAPETQVSGQKIRSVNFANWSDLEARDALLTAVHRETRILIHGDDIASTGLWMHKWWGQMAIQMRRFPMMAMSKQLGRAMHMRDMDTVMDFIMTGTVGAMSFAAQTELKSIGMADQDKQKFLDKNMSWGRIVAAGLQRNPYSGMVPQLVDTIASHTYGTPVFDARGSGMSTDLVSLDSTPVLSALSNISSSIAAPVQSTLNSDKRYTQREWKALMGSIPLGNALPMVWLTNAMAENFPKAQLPSGPKAKGSLLDQALDE